MSGGRRDMPSTWKNIRAIYLNSLKDISTTLEPAASEHSPPRTRLTTLSKNINATFLPSPQNIPSQNRLPQNIPSQNSLPQNILFQNSLSQNIPFQNSLSQNIPVLPPTPDNSSNLESLLFQAPSPQGCPLKISRQFERY